MGGWVDSHKQVMTWAKLDTDVQELASRRLFALQNVREFDLRSDLLWPEVFVL